MSFAGCRKRECVKIMKFGNGYEKMGGISIGHFIFYMFSKRYFNHDFFFDFRLSEILALVLIGIAVVTLFKYPNELYFDSGKLIFTVIYVALPFSFALGLPKFSSYSDSFSLEVLFLFILIWSSDTFAYLVGKFFGKHKMALKYPLKNLGRICRRCCFNIGFILLLLNTISLS